MLTSKCYKIYSWGNDIIMNEVIIRLNFIKEKVCQATTNNVSSNIIFILCSDSGYVLINKLVNNLLSLAVQENLLINQLSALKCIDSLIEGKLINAIYNDEVYNALNCLIVLILISSKNDSWKWYLKMIDSQIRKLIVKDSDKSEDNLKKRKIINFIY